MCAPAAPSRFGPWAVSLTSDFPLRGRAGRAWTWMPPIVRRQSKRQPGRLSARADEPSARGRGSQGPRVSRVSAKSSVEVPHSVAAGAAPGRSPSLSR